MVNADPNENRTISISIPQWMYDWLEKDGKKINRSKLFREAVEAKMQPQQEKVSSLMFLISIMGIVFSIALIGIAVTPSPIHIFARAIMALLGGLLAILTAYTYYKEKSEISSRG